MTIDAIDNAATPQVRFLLMLARWMRLWIACIAIALVSTLFGLFPTVISVFALLGPIWVPIVVLILWGRMLDQTMHPRSDVEDGCR